MRAVAYIVHGCAMSNGAGVYVFNFKQYTPKRKAIDTWKKSDGMKKKKFFGFVLIFFLDLDPFSPNFLWAGGAN